MCSQPTFTARWGARSALYWNDPECAIIIPPWLESWWQERCTQHYDAVIATKKSTLYPTFLNQDLPQLYKLLEYLTIPAIQRLAPLHHHIPSCQEVYITHQRTSGRGPGLVCAANQRTGFHENSLRQKINQAYKALQRSTQERQHKYSSPRQTLLMTWALWLVSWNTVSHITWECLLKNTCAIYSIVYGIPLSFFYPIWSTQNLWSHWNRVKRWTKQLILAAFDKRFPLPQFNSYMPRLQKVAFSLRSLRPRSSWKRCWKCTHIVNIHKCTQLHTVKHNYTEFQTV